MNIQITLIYEKLLHLAKLVVCFENEKERDEAMRRNKNFIGGFNVQ